ncbi:oligosaccharide flippase family protein [bacterium]|nr:oligosaccharide flippase family protein [bacterium]
MSQAPEIKSDPNTRFVGGAIWMIALRWLMRAIGLVSTITLARLLTPQDFGLVAMAMVVYALIDSMATTGVDLALIRNPKDSLELHNAAWTIQILQGLFVAVVMLACIPLAIDYFQEDRLQAILSLLALAALIQGFRNIGTVAFRKELDFAKEFRFILTQKIIVFLITMSLAFWLRDYRAMVFGMLSQSVIEVFLSYRMHSYRPKISTSGIREIWSFSQWLLISRIGMVLNQKSGQLIAGRAVGTDLLGVYHMGVELGTIFVQEIIMPARRALFPNMSRLQAEPNFSERAIDILGLLFLACVPVGVGLHLIAYPIVVLLLGEHWLSVVPILSWMSLFGVAIGINLALDLVLLVKKRANLSARKAWLEVIFLIPVLIYASKDGEIEHIAIARVIVAACVLPLMIYYTAAALNVSVLAVYGVLWRPLAAGGVMIIIDNFVFSALQFGLLTGLIAQVFVGVFTYFTCLTVFWALRGKAALGPEKTIFDYLAAQMKSRMASS